MENNKIKINKKETNKAKDIICRLLCLLSPVIMAFAGYFISPYIWELLNKDEVVPELFKFVVSFIFFILPTTFIFIESRKLNPIIKITITDKKN